MATQNRSTIGAIVVEVTEGVAVAPSSASEDYIALQDGFSMSPSFNQLDNAELTGSIGSAKSVLGLEEPSASLSHYMKHSNVEGTEPAFGLLIESLLGDKEVESTEYDTVASSTAGSATAAAIIKVDSGEGVQFERGQGLLIKDATNGYSIRNVLSVATDDLTLGFNLANAPSSGVNLGKAVMYKPADSGHPTFSTWYYRGDGGFTEMMAGSRVTNMSISATAGEFINADFSIEGVEYYYDPILISASDIYIDFTDDQGTVAATITAQWYKDPHELAAAIQTAMDGQTSETITCTYSDSTGKFTIASSTSAVLSLLWNTGSNAANTVGDKIGFSVAADDTGSTSYTSDSALSFAAPNTPSYDPTSPLVAKSNEIMLGDFDDYACLGASEISISIDGTKSDLLSMCATSGKAGSLITGREVTVDLVSRVSQYDADKFKRFRSNSNTQFCWNFGEKSGGNWVAGKCGNVFIPSATIVNHEIQDTDGVLELSMSLKAYVADGLGEIYINFL